MLDYFHITEAIDPFGQTVYIEQWVSHEKGAFYKTLLVRMAYAFYKG